MRRAENKSEMLWLDSMKHRKDGVLDLQIKDEPVYALGTYFSNDDEPSDRENFLDKLTKLEKNFKLLASKGNLRQRKNRYYHNVSPFKGHFCL